MIVYNIYIYYLYIGIYIHTHWKDKGAMAGHDSRLTVSDINYSRYRDGGLRSTTLFAHHGNETTHRRRAENSNILTPFWSHRIEIMYIYAFLVSENGSEHKIENRLPTHKQCNTHTHDIIEVLHCIIILCMSNKR